MNTGGIGRTPRHIGAAFKRVLNARPPQDGPLISIVMPAYNDEEFVSRSVGSCLAQTYERIEIVCVDDASSDATAVALENLAASDELGRVKIITLEENSGPHNARRAGIVQATGEIVCFLDADDELVRDACAKIASEWMRHPFEILHFSTRVCRDGKADIEQALDVAAWTTPVSGELYGREILDSSFIRGEYSFSIWGKAYRADLVRRAFDALGERKSDFGEDALEYFAIAYFATSYRGVPGERLYVYHLGNGLSARRDMTASQFERTLRGVRSIDGMREFLESQDAFDQYGDIYEAHRSGQFASMLKSWWNDVAMQDREEVLHRILELWPREDVIDGVSALGSDAIDVLQTCLGDELSFTAEQLYRRGVADGAAASRDEYEASASYRVGRMLTAIPRRLKSSLMK